VTFSALSGLLLQLQLPYHATADPRPADPPVQATG
jgi:hypothetical protein